MRQLLLLAVLLAACATSPDGRRSSELKVTRAVLYQNGIGYFERRGRVDDELLRLRVRPDQIRDVLKSLTVVDLGSGRPVSIALPIEKGRAKQLSDLPEQVRTRGGVLAIAEAFRGARCRVEADGTAAGRLVGVENLGASEGGTPDWRVSVLTDEGSLRQVKVAEIRSLDILDGTLEIGLRKALDAALDAGAWKPVELAIRLAGESPHDLVVSYVVEMPTWKPAYRLVVGEANGKGQALLQGWAVVDNVSGDDWREVQLSLTAGTPLAFTYDLYTPRYPQRPHLAARDELAQVPLEAFQAQTGIAAAPEESEDAPMAGAMEGLDAPAAPPAPAARSAMPSFAAPAPQRKSLAREPRAAMSPELLQRNYKNLVAGSTVGSLFRYDIEEPVTIEERQSALVNVVNAKVEGEQVLLFRVGSDATAPFRAVRFKNDSGFVLEAGPIAIYQSDATGGTFLGEALAGRIEKGAMSFVPFAQDGRVRLTLSEEQKNQGMSLLKVANGVITGEAKSVTRYLYDVDNGSGEEAVLYVRRERRPGWTLVPAEGQKVIEEGGAYYVPIKLAKSGRTTVTVEEQTPVRRTVDIWSDLAREAIALYLTGSSIDPKVATQFREALALREKVGQLDRQIETHQQQRAAQSQRQQEVRENIRVLGKAASKNAPLRDKLETTLAQLDEQLNEVTQRLVALSMERSETRDRLATLMAGISLDTGR